MWKTLYDRFGKNKDWVIPQALRLSPAALDRVKQGLETGVLNFNGELNGLKCRNGQKTESYQRKLDVSGTALTIGDDNLSDARTCAELLEAITAIMLGMAVAGGEAATPSSSRTTGCGGGATDVANRSPARPLATAAAVRLRRGVGFVGDGFGVAALALAGLGCVLRFVRGWVCCCCRCGLPAACVLPCAPRLDPPRRTPFALAPPFEGLLCPSPLPRSGPTGPEAVPPAAPPPVTTPVVAAPPAPNDVGCSSSSTSSSTSMAARPDPCVAGCADGVWAPTVWTFPFFGGAGRRAACTGS